MQQLTHVLNKTLLNSHIWHSIYDSADHILSTPISRSSC